MTDKTTRSFDDILADLTTVENESDDHKVQVMAYALRWAYASLRAGHALENRLKHDADLAALVDAFCQVWDEQSYISGAFRAANNYAYQLACHRETLTDEEWINYYYQIGFDALTDDAESQIWAAVEYDLAENGQLPACYYED